MAYSLFFLLRHVQPSLGQLLRHACLFAQIGPFLIRILQHPCLLRLVWRCRLGPLGIRIDSASSVSITLCFALTGAGATVASSRSVISHFSAFLWLRVGRQSSGFGLISIPLGCPASILVLVLRHPFCFGLVGTPFESGCPAVILVRLARHHAWFVWLLSVQK